ncbi:HEAT repeat-containing protein 3 [Danaus plexippus]|uniref:HEAT repeat-containing protein 3 n=1 Tax=Danaus plexippus TaxID=13037 RepID=UPI002AAF5D38|nr:HEAT repeat-containing protein 3 [Danaus plexippus]
MGKVRKRKVRHNAPVNNSDEEELPVESKESAIQTIIDQLQVSNVEEKYCGLQTFAMLLECPENLEQMIKRGLIKIVAPLLLDAASSVRNAAAGSLRNLSAIRFDLCDVLMEQDVMTSLICFFHQFAENWTPDPASKSKDEDIDTFVQCTYLLLNLCESSELAMKYVGDSRILDIFCRYLDLSTFGIDIVTAILQCLFVIVEDNPKAVDKLKNSCERQLRELLSIEGNDPSNLLIKSVAGGLTISLCGGNIVTLPTAVLNQIIGILAQTLSVDHRLACNQLSSNVPLGDGAGKVKIPEGKEAMVLEKQVKSVIQVLDAQQSAIEIITNICSSEDLDEVMDGMESSDSDEPTEDSIGEGTLLPEDKLPPELLEALISLEIYDKIWARTQLPPENVMSILKEYEGTQLVSKKLYSLQTRSLLCVNNMIMTLPLDNLGGINGVYKIWVDAGKLVFKNNSNNFDILESATAVMRAALDKLQGYYSAKDRKLDDNNLFKDLALSDIEIMLTGIRDCQVPEIRSNLIRMIGTMALLLVNNLNDITTNVIITITEFIIEQAHKENEVWVLAEAIDTIVDLYSEDETDSLAAKIKLGDKLSMLAPILKNKARQQKKLPKEYKVLVATANSNLPRFIKYLKGRT